MSLAASPTESKLDTSRLVEAGPGDLSETKTNNEESYDNLNQSNLIEASYVIEDEDYDNGDGEVSEELPSLKDELKNISVNQKPVGISMFLIVS